MSHRAPRAEGNPPQLRSDRAGKDLGYLLFSLAISPLSPQLPMTKTLCWGWVNDTRCIWRWTKCRCDSRSSVTAGFRACARISTNYLFCCPKEYPWDRTQSPEKLRICSKVRAAKLRWQVQQAWGTLSKKPQSGSRGQRTRQKPSCSGKNTSLPSANNLTAIPQPS